MNCTISLTEVIVGELAVMLVLAGIGIILKVYQLARKIK